MAGEACDGCDEESVRGLSTDDRCILWRKASWQRLNLLVNIGGESCRNPESLGLLVDGGDSGADSNILWTGTHGTSRVSSRQ